MKIKNEILPMLVAFAHRQAYRESEGFPYEDLTLKLSESGSETLDGLAQELALAANVSVEAARSALVNLALHRAAAAFESGDLSPQGLISGWANKARTRLN